MKRIIVLFICLLTFLFSVTITTDRSIEDGYVLGGTNALPDSVAVKIFGHRIDQVIDK